MRAQWIEPVGDRADDRGLPHLAQAEDADRLPLLNALAKIGDDRIAADDLARAHRVSLLEHVVEGQVLPEQLGQRWELVLDGRQGNPLSPLQREPAEALLQPGPAVDDNQKIRVQVEIIPHQLLPGCLEILSLVLIVDDEEEDLGRYAIRLLKLFGNAGAENPPVRTNHPELGYRSAVSPQAAEQGLAPRDELKEVALHKPLLAQQELELVADGDGVGSVRAEKALPHDEGAFKIGAARPTIPASYSDETELVKNPCQREAVSAFRPFADLGSPFKDGTSPDQLISAAFFEQVAETFQGVCQLRASRPQFVPDSHRALLIRQRSLAVSDTGEMLSEGRAKPGRRSILTVFRGIGHHAQVGLPGNQPAPLSRLVGTFQLQVHYPFDRRGVFRAGSLPEPGGHPGMQRDAIFSRHRQTQTSQQLESLGQLSILFTLLDGRSQKAEGNRLRGGKMRRTKGQRARQSCDGAFVVQLIERLIEAPIESGTARPCRTGALLPEASD